MFDLLHNVMLHKKWLKIHFTKMNFLKNSKSTFIAGKMKIRICTLITKKYSHQLGVTFQSPQGMWCLLTLIVCICFPVMSSSGDHKI